MKAHRSGPDLIFLAAPELFHVVQRDIAKKRPSGVPI